MNGIGSSKVLCSSVYFFLSAEVRWARGVGAVIATRREMMWAARRGTLNKMGTFIVVFRMVFCFASLFKWPTSYTTSTANPWNRKNRRRY